MNELKDKEFKISDKDNQQDYYFSEFTPQKEKPMLNKGSNENESVFKEYINEKSKFNCKIKDEINKCSKNLYSPEKNQKGTLLEYKYDKNSYESLIYTPIENEILP